MKWKRMIHDMHLPVSDSVKIEVYNFSLPLKMQNSPLCCDKNQDN